MTVTQVPATASARADEEQAARVGEADDAGVAEVEAADLVARAVAVLDRAHHAQPRVPLALELQDDVDEVLEHARAGDGAVLGDVADEDRGDAALLRDADQRRRRPRAPG